VEIDIQPHSLLQRIVVLDSGSSVEDLMIAINSGEEYNLGVKLLQFA